MNSDFEIILRLTSGSISNQEVARLFKDFARVLGWEPSDRLEPDTELRELTNGHLIVDHGLEQSAVITFMKSPVAYLQPEQRKKILSLSYNNLIDWHIYVEQEKASFVFNRQHNPESIVRQISAENFDSLRSTMFDQITGTAKNPNFPTLDNALIENISYWKRNIAAELKGKPGRFDYSTLFNGIIFIRAAEDHIRRKSGENSSILLDILRARENTKASPTLKQIIEVSLKAVIKDRVAKTLLNIKNIDVFNTLPFDFIYDLLSSFYKDKTIPLPL